MRIPYTCELRFPLLGVWQAPAGSTASNFRLHHCFPYELIYQLNAIEYLLCSFSSTCFGLTRPSSGAMDVNFLTYAAYGVLGVVRCRS